MAYRKMELEEVKEIIEKHKEWLEEVFGKRPSNYSDEYYDKVDNYDFSKLPEHLADDYRRADFSKVKFTMENTREDYRGVFDVVNLSGANFKGADFSETNGEVFHYTRLNYADLSGVKVPVNSEEHLAREFGFGCEFRHANLKGIPESEIDHLRDSCDLDHAITDKGECKSVLVPFSSSHGLPNDYWQANFYGLPDYAHLSYRVYTNIPFEPNVVTHEDKEELKAKGYEFSEKQRFLKFNEGQKISLSAGRDSVTVDAAEFAKHACDNFLGQDKVPQKKTVTNDKMIWFVKFNPTARAPRNAIEFIPVEGTLVHNRLAVDQREFVNKTRVMINKLGFNIGLERDMIDRAEHFVIHDKTKICSPEPSMGDSYPTYFLGNDKLAIKGNVVLSPFIYTNYDDKSKFSIGEPYNVRTMNDFVETLMEVQNEKRINFYKELSRANGIVPDNISDKELTDLAKEHMILIKKPWQLEALIGEYNEKSMQNINKFASHLDCLSDEETLAMQQDAKAAKFLYYNTMDIAKQVEYIANDIRSEMKFTLEESAKERVPAIPNDTAINKFIEMYNDCVFGKELAVAKDAKEVKGTKKASKGSLRPKTSKKKKDKENTSERK